MRGRCTSSGRNSSLFELIWMTQRIDSFGIMRSVLKPLCHGLTKNIRVIRGCEEGIRLLKLSKLKNLIHSFLD